MEDIHSNKHSRSINVKEDGVQIQSDKDSALNVVVTSTEGSTHEANGQLKSTIPWKMKVFAILLVSATGFGSHWSSGVTGAMKSTLKKVSFLVTKTHIR